MNINYDITISENLVQMLLAYHCASKLIPVLYVINVGNLWTKEDPLFPDFFLWVLDPYAGLFLVFAPYYGIIGPANGSKPRIVL